MLVHFHRQRIAVPFEPLIMLLAEAKPLHGRSADGAGRLYTVLLQMAGPTEALQVDRRVVSPVLVLVMHVRPARRATLGAAAFRQCLPRVVVRRHPAWVCLLRSLLEGFCHATTPAELPAIEVQQGFQGPIRGTLPLQPIGAELTASHWRRLHRHRHV